MKRRGSSKESRSSIFLAAENLDISWEEREEVEQTLRSRSDGSVQLLRKLVPYFDGTHHVEEILFNEMLSGVCEKDLEKLLIEFSNILITYIRPETV